MGFLSNVRRFLEVKERRTAVGSSATSITDKAGRKPLTVGLTLLIVLRLTSIGGMDPPDMTVNFFGIIPPPLGVATVVPVNFAQKSLQYGNS